MFFSTLTTSISKNNSMNICSRSRQISPLRYLHGAPLTSFCLSTVLPHLLSHCDSVASLSVTVKFSASPFLWSTFWFGGGRKLILWHYFLHIHRNMKKTRRKFYISTFSCLPSSSQGSQRPADSRCCFIDFPDAFTFILEIFAFPIFQWSFTVLQRFLIMAISPQVNLSCIDLIWLHWKSPTWDNRVSRSFERGTWMIQQLLHP